MHRRLSALGIAVSGIVAATTVLTGPLASPATSQAGPRAANLAQPDARPPGVSGGERSSASPPVLRVTRVVGGLDIPWDVKSIGGGRLLITERATKRLLTWRAGRLRAVRFPSRMVWASGETGLMGLAIDPGFASNRRFYTCQGGYLSGGRHDVRVIAWRLTRGARAARLSRTLLGGLPASSGRHGGCRLLVSRSGALVVGTGDAATTGNPRNLGSLGGKTLMLNRMTGAPWPYNPFIGSSNRNARYVHTYGHRNVQGLAQRADGSLWSVEHGTYRDDEVNVLFKGGDYGWEPGPGYDESPPMTDQGLPGSQVDARWSSGDPTIAPSGATWVYGNQWGSYNGTLAVAVLKGQRLMFQRYDASGRFTGIVTNRLTGFGRLRSVTQIPGGDLLVTTSNGGHGDSVLRVHAGR